MADASVPAAEYPADWRDQRARHRLRLYEGDNGYLAMVAEVDVDQDTGQVRVTRLVIAQDSGPISNPDGIRNQIEGGALQGLSRALGEAVTWDDRDGDVDRLAHVPVAAPRLRRAAHRGRVDQSAG